MKLGYMRRAMVFILMMAVTTFSSGCAAGNFGFTRGVAKWNLKMALLPRILVYILFVIIPVYGVALLLDLILNNTIEFWTGSALLTAQNKTFYKDGLRVDVVHSADPLRKTVMTVYDKMGKVSSVVELRENSHQAIELYVDNVKKAEVTNIKDGMIQLLHYQESLGQAVTKQTFALQQFDGLNARSQVQDNFRQVQKLVNTTLSKPMHSLAINSLR